MACSWLPLYPCTHVLEKWFRLAVMVGGSPPQRIHFVVGDDNLRPGEWYCNSDRGPTLRHSLAKWT